MKMKKISTFLVVLALSGSGYAGFNGITHHSRANCGNNETISWHAGHSYWFWVVSRHRSRTHDHQVVQDWVIPGEPLLLSMFLIVRYMMGGGINNKLNKELK